MSTAVVAENGWEESLRRMDSGGWRGGEKAVDKAVEWVYLPRPGSSLVQLVLFQGLPARSRTSGSGEIFSDSARF
jgi:hypothetical protein